MFRIIGVPSASSAFQMTSEYFHDILTKTPVKRFGKPEDIASTILFLVSDEASFITGETICVSGGLHMR